MQPALLNPTTCLHRQAPPAARQKRDIVLPPFTGEAQQLVMELATAIYIVEVINNDGGLQKVCETLNVTALFFEGLNGSLAKEKICAAAAQPPPPANESSFNGIIALATALYAVEVAGHYAGGTNLTALCSVVDAQTISLLGFDGPLIKDYVCSAALNQTTGPSCSAGPLPTTPGSPLNGTTSLQSSGTAPAGPISGTLQSSGTAPAGPIGGTGSPHTVITILSTVTFHSTITLRPSGTAPASPIDTSSESLTIVGTGSTITPGSVTNPTAGPMSGSGTNDKTTSTILLQHYTPKPYWHARAY